MSAKNFICNDEYYKQLSVLIYSSMLSESDAECVLSAFHSWFLNLDYAIYLNLVTAAIAYFEGVAYAE